MSVTEGDVPATQRIAELEQALEDKKREVEALSFDVMRMRAMLEHSPVGVFQDDGATGCVYVNPAWCSIVGLRSEDATGLGWVRTLYPEDMPELRKRHEEARAVNGQFAGDYRIIRPNGEIRWVHGQSAPIFSPTGMLLGYLGTIHDITDRVETRNALEKLRDSLENTVIERTRELQRVNDRLRMYGALFEYATDAIVLTTPDGTITHVNPAYKRLFGADEEIIGLSLTNAIPWNDATAAKQVCDVGQQAHVRHDVSLRSANGELVMAHVDVYAVQEEMTDMCGIAIIIHDLTAQKRAEAERLDFEARIIAMQAEIIRELSTPLLPIGRGIIAMALVGSLSDERGHQMIQTLLSGVQEYNAKMAIVDITGVRRIDAHAAHALKSAARAIRLLGTKLIVSGTTATVARAIIDQGIDMSDVQTTSTLAAAMDIALGKSSKDRRSRARS